MPSYVLPQVLVFQEFEAGVASLEQPLRACIVGPNYELHRYSNSAEKADILVDSHYDPDNEECYAWPGRPAGGEVDPTYTRVFFDDALLEYFHHAIGDGNDVNWVLPGKNRVRCANLIFKTANGYARSADFNSRDVAVGDVARLMSAACGRVVELETKVTGFAADKVAAVVGDATGDAGNAPTSIPDATGIQTAGDLNCVNINAVDGSAYDGIDDGYVSEIYTVEVIGASVGGDGSTAILKVTSASGTDDQAAVNPSAFSAPTAIGTRGLLVTWDNNCSSSGGPGSSSVDPGVDPDDFLLGQIFVFTVSQLWWAPTATSGGVYRGETDTTYVIEATKGGWFASADLPQISVTTTTGVDVSGPTDVPDQHIDVLVGTQGVLVQFDARGVGGLSKGDRYYITVTAEKDGAIRTLIFANNLPDEFRGICAGSGGGSSSSSSLSPLPDLDLRLFIEKDIEVSEDRIGFAPDVNWTQSGTEICIKDGIIAYDSSWTGGGVELPLEVKDGKIYIQYRALLTDDCEVVSELSEASAVSETLGTVDPDNPLAFGVYKALLNSNGVEVKYLALCGTEFSDWENAVDVLVGRDDVYGLVPLTQDKNVLDLFVAHSDAESTPENGRWRICWLNMPAVDIKPIYTELSAGVPILATILDDPDTSGTQYTLVEAAGAEFSTKGVKAGDTVRALYQGDGFGNWTYSSFTIDSVESEESLLLLTGPSVPVSVPSKIEIHRTLSRNELADDLVLNPGLFSNRRAYLVWPDVVGNAGVTFPGYFLCAALSGLRSGVLPHQGLTNVEIVGFDDVTRTTELFSASQLNEMAGAGYWIVTQDPGDGTIFTRHQLSTDNSTLNYKEQSITTNLDSISFAFLYAMKDFIGKGNVTQTMLQLIKAEIFGLLAQFQNNVIVDRLGAQILSGTITELKIHETLRDRIVARVRIDLPEPLNNLELHLIVAAS